uniref:Uncharacterized protein n=1 Tax=Kumanoa americana TaxID=1196377 RepID=A0A1C9CGJ4_9FLOR|nr:hypothetical protein Kuma_051 [Kumanoa americana]AOM67485.1 hypothetical protein Kuma_051 [Kumanoa americana]
MINLFELTFYQDYLYSPNTWLHKLTSYSKVFITVLYLACLPFTSLFFLLLINCYFITLSFTLLIPSLFFNRLYKQLFMAFIILSVLCISLNERHSKHLIKLNYTISTTNNSYVYQLLTNVMKCNEKQVFKIYKITFQIQILLSIKIMRFFLLIASCLLIHKLLVITTRSKDIVLTYFICFLYCFPFINKDIFFILILSEECISLFEKRIKNMQMSILLRGNKLSLLNYYLRIIELYMIGFNMLYKMIFIDVQTISYSLYSREIFPQTQQIWLLK